MEEITSDACRWYTCKECKRFYAIPRYLWAQLAPNVQCGEGHTILYYPNSVAWERLTALYGLLSSLYITMPRFISFAQYEQALTIIEQLKALE
jgi:hypothetical protein